MELSPLGSSPSAPGPAAASAAAGNGGGGEREGEACEQAKVFVGGIPWDATEEALRGYFVTYGEVVDAVIVKDRGTGNARGFGFVSFADPSAADRAVRDAAAKHSILGRPVEVRRAIPRGAQHHNQHHEYYNDYQHQNRGFNKSSGRTMDGGQTASKKIFVGGLSANITQEEFKEYFEKFGKITDVVVMYDSATNRPRGFGFITFDAEESVENAIKTAFHTLNGKTVEVKRAVPREGSYNKNNENGSSNPRMGNGKESNLNGYPARLYPPYSPRFGAFQGYGAHPYAHYAYGGGYGGGYAFGVHGLSYGAPYASPWNTWNGRGFVDIRQSPVPYGATGFYPGCYNTGISPYVGVGVGGYHGPANGFLERGVVHRGTEGGGKTDTGRPGDSSVHRAMHVPSYKKREATTDFMEANESFSPSLN
ncbi:hypothetical protein Taro_035746 [Colocasia esculenta]|uniref:RRM domain-containing protein n=1 Tax=Colocasia esculenta TaxID=4460 RepID=A0A843W4Q9_COLES|nr:hypothetical protein [Colocasia esculenta]